MEKSPGWEKFASSFHDKLKEVMLPYKNKTLQTARIKEIIEKVNDFRGQEQDCRHAYGRGYDETDQYLGADLVSHEVAEQDQCQGRNCQQAGGGDNEFEKNERQAEHNHVKS